MPIFTTRIKKMIALTCTTFVIIFINIPFARAALSDPFNSSSSLLAAIAEYTYNTMQELNALPALISPLIMLTTTWLDPDSTDTTKNLQSDLGTLNVGETQSTNGQVAVQPYILWDLFGASPVSWAPNLTYQTLLGMSLPTANPRPDKAPADTPAYNYLKYASGMGIGHTPPSPSWSGAKSDIAGYTNYYNTILSIETFNAYAISRIYADRQMGITQAQQQSLMDDAGSSTWFTRVASESLGVVLRQILMFNSQMFIVMKQILETQRELLAAQAMTNTVLIATSQSNEQLLLRKAVQPMPGSGA